MDAVMETYEARDFTLWPTAAPPADGLLPLSGRLSPAETGTAMAVLATYNKGERRRGARDPEDGGELIRRLKATERVVAPGGLRLTDTATGVTAAPGCCVGTEDWRDWLGLATGEEPWLGHDPTPVVEHAGAIVRLWPDEDRGTGRSIDIPRAQLPVLLGSVQEDLAGFLACVGRWAATHVPSTTASALTEKLDEDWAVSAPLPEVPHGTPSG
ncbi:hypothetical protein ABT040_30890 [Streptomyces sp. NPDC002688]|uniref:hypothetical protein n=1 Tax=Streptomyces sp. NPDC002688 TaxID=3154423 RepID=UPI00332FF6CB